MSSELEKSKWAEARYQVAIIMADGRERTKSDLARELAGMNLSNTNLSGALGSLSGMGILKRLRTDQPFSWQYFG